VPDPRFLITETGSSPGVPLPAPPRTLPDDLLQEAAQRLGIISLVIAGLVLAELLVVHLTPEDVTKSSHWVSVFDVLASAIVLVSLGLFWYSRGRSRNPRFLLNLALGYEIFLALTVGLLNYAGQPPTGVSWVAVIIVLFAAMVPSTPGKTFTAALLAALMDPAAAGLWERLGRTSVGLHQALLLAIPNYLCALVAPVISHIIARLGREVRRAREMGSYVLGEVIGRGGMGEVREARHRFLARPAAVKLIQPAVLRAVTEVQTDVLVERFHREARAAANLRSPHTIQLYDFGIANDGTFYYVMELLNGMDLQTLVEEYGPLPPARVIHLLRQACESLAEAHERSLIHRDIKPANIQVCSMGHYFDFVKVLDFGLVKHASGGMAGEPVDRRTDIYALGCVAYWMLTGRQVIRGNGVVQTMARHIHTQPDPPSLYSLFRIPPELDAIVLACLAKNPEDRPDTARALAGRLTECEVDDQWGPEHARLWWESRLGPEPAMALGRDGG
jgi:eukaryotic-like serine/threonine-protein kinase